MPQLCSHHICNRFDHISHRCVLITYAINVFTAHVQQVCPHHICYRRVNITYATGVFTAHMPQVCLQHMRFICIQSNTSKVSSMVEDRTTMHYVHVESVYAAYTLRTHIQLAEYMIYTTELIYIRKMYICVLAAYMLFMD